MASFKDGLFGSCDTHSPGERRVAFPGASLSQDDGRVHEQHPKSLRRRVVAPAMRSAHWDIPIYSD